MGRLAQLRGALVEAYLGERAQRLRRALRGALGDARRLDVYLQIDDPYSYLLSQRLPEVVSGAGLALAVHIVPAPAPEMDPEPELRRRHALLDAGDLARRFELSFPARPRRASTREVLIANAIMLRHRSADEQLAAAARVGAALLSGDEAELGRAAEALGKIELSLVPDELRAGAARLRRAGHYQGAMLHMNGDWYWGIDRLHYLEAELRAGGRACKKSMIERQRTSLPAVRLSSEPPVLELFFSFRSPYSYLAIDRVMALADRYEVALRIKPVLPMVMRGMAVPRTKRMYILSDAAREARRLGIPFGRICDPLGVGVERCLAVFDHAERAGRASAFVVSAARGIWSEALDVASDHDLAVIVRRAGLEWPAAQRALGDLAWRARADERRRELAACGLWGVPSFRVGDYVGWGQDRLDHLEDRLGWLWWSAPEERRIP